MQQAEERGATDQRASVSELVSDIDAELRLHAARIQEFLDGTSEFSAVTDMLARAHLLRTLQVLNGSLSDMDDLRKSTGASMTGPSERRPR